MAAVLKKHSGAKIKRGVSRNKEMDSKVWEEERKGLCVRNPRFNTKPSLQPLVRFHTWRQIERQMQILTQAQPSVISKSIFMTFLFSDANKTHIHRQAHARTKSWSLWWSTKESQCKGRHSWTVSQSDWLDTTVGERTNFCSDLYPIWWIYLF